MSNIHADFESRAAHLSFRERQILIGVLFGLTNHGIAARAGISHRTVEIHRREMFRKMNARTASALLRAALAA